MHVLSLELDELMENNIVVVEHDDPDEHGYPFSLACVNKIYTDASYEGFVRYRSPISLEACVR